MKIYKITTPHSTKCYVGKTTRALQTRVTEHGRGYLQWLDMTGRHWCSSVGLMMLGDCSIELLEETEDIQAERKWIAQLDCVNSMHMKYGSGDQYDHGAYQKEYYKQPHIRRRNRDRERAYVAANREHVRVQQKGYYEKRQAARMECNLCGTNVAVTRIQVHQKTKKCQTLYAAKCEK